MAKKYEKYIRLEVVMPREMRPWLCKNNHILGFVRWNGNDLPQLMVLREALDMQADHPDDVDLLGPLDGMMPIRCSICDDVAVWCISVESLVALFMSLSDKTMLEFSQRLLELSRMKVDLDDPASAPPPAPPRRTGRGEE